MQTISLLWTWGVGRDGGSSSETATAKARPSRHPARGIRSHTIRVIRITRDEQGNAHLRKRPICVTAHAHLRSGPSDAYVYQPICVEAGSQGQADNVGRALGAAAALQQPGP